jgi:hypothetical protein
LFAAASDVGAAALLVGIFVVFLGVVLAGCIGVE